ncbi:hypothetical protein BD410DRAFT_796480 [Rickenella mellea]|uniref:Phosphoglycerate mutase family protein n=1 Tax=Rickenella mellea TaxID=50990 RepID=A0A4Y7PJG4_9AGAM|nr:hypothetical protein BD410DRAFT_796480 [Rickenella mellea]
MATIPPPATENTTTTPAAPIVPNTIYLIRHGEKPSGDGEGLSAAGEVRAQALARVFGKDSPYNIGYILAEKPHKHEHRARPVETVTPLAASLGLTVDTSCERDDAPAVARAVSAFAATSDKNILICWEHKALRDIAAGLGVIDPPHYPGEEYVL